MAYVGVGITELALIGVADPGIANSERIVLRPTQTMNLTSFAVALGVFDTETGGAKPIYDNVYWFRDIVVSPPSWILLYTGKGEPQELTLPSGERVITLFWQRDRTMFGHPALVPILFQLGGAVVGRRL